MSLLNLQVELSWLRPLFERLVNAVERIAGPELQPLPHQRQSTLADYAIVTPEAIFQAQDAQEGLGLAAMAVPGSPAMEQFLKDYEQDIRTEFDEVTANHIIRQLPWKIQTGPEQSSAGSQGTTSTLEPHKP